MPIPDSKYHLPSQKEVKLFSKNYWHYIVLLTATVIFISICLKLDLTQDDAYISFRYASNLLSGHGLVYNIGERVEGYTNFLWVILLALFKGLLGVEFLTFTKVVGVISGSIIYILLFLLLRIHFTKIPLALHIMVVVALLSNLSIAYWSISGLETSTFSLFVLSALIAEYRLSKATPFLLVTASLLRPEGILVFGIILINRVIKNRIIPWRFLLLFVSLLIPFGLFKIIYYGSLLPNPYYAKSGMGYEYILNGLEYTWYFASTSGVYGIILLIPLLMLKKLWEKYSLLYLFIFFYTLYIIWVGGDVLRAYRFFVPVVPILTFLFVVSLVELIFFLMNDHTLVYRISFACIAVYSYLSYSFSQEYIWKSRDSEKELTAKMFFLSGELRRYMKYNFSVAASTIGVAGYELVEHRIIDMLGLTDKYIARNPEKVEGLSINWKERRFNSQYLLEQQPDFILFSTEIKPSAPAEQALMLHSEFRNKYVPLGFQVNKKLRFIWWRKERIDMSKDVICSDVEFVNKFSEACHYDMRGDSKNALISLNKSQLYLGEEYALIAFMKGYTYHQLKMNDSAAIYLEKALLLDSLYWQARLELSALAMEKGDKETVLHHQRIVINQCPWFLNINK